MPPDSLSLASALALFAASVGGWVLAAPLKAAARLYLRFAAILFASLAAASLLRMADVAALFLLPLAAASLTVSALARFARPLNSFAASAVLVAALAGGLGAMLSGLAMLALAPAMLAGLAVIAAALNRVAALAALAGAGLFLASLAYVEQGAGAGVLLFCAAALVGLAQSPQRSTLAVDQKRAARMATAIGGLDRNAVIPPSFRPVGHRLAQDLRDK
ncbi:MAG TPA: hypothetical protein VGC16_00590 [Rhizomicrobium sp.]